MEEIVVTIAPDGTPKISVTGVAGKSCKDLTAALEKQLGTVTEDKNTPEYYERESHATNKNTTGR